MGQPWPIFHELPGVFVRSRLFKAPGYHPDIFNVGRKQYSGKFLAERVHKNVRRLSNFTTLCFVFWRSWFQIWAGRPTTLTEVYTTPPSASHYAAKSILRVLSSSLFAKHRIVARYTVWATDGIRRTSNK